jgi:hypothetical protein
LEIAKQRPDVQPNPGYAFDEGHHKITFGQGFEIPVFNRKGPIAEAEARFNALRDQAIGEMKSALAACQGARAEPSDAERALLTVGTTRTGAMEQAVGAGEEDPFRAPACALKTPATHALASQPNAVCSRSRGAR